MSIVEYRGGPITHRYLMNKSKDELATMVMRTLPAVWLPIETAPRDTGSKVEYVLICEAGCLPDIAVWQGKRKRKLGPHDDVKAWIDDIPEGWFNRSGQRSRVLRPTHWMPLPAAP